MVFSSLVFLFAFLPIVLLVYYLSPKVARNMIILISGLIFYAWGEPIYVFVMVISVFVDYTAGLIIHRFNDNKKIQTIVLVISLVMNLSLLGVFKYSGFLIENINGIFGTSISNPDLPLPIGISFFTFQSMSYTIDMFMGKIKVQKNFITFAAFVTLFPQIVAGPIVRYLDIEKELRERRVDFSTLYDGILLFVNGLAKKVLIANNIGLLWDQVKAIPSMELSAATAWLGILGFTFQIYFDFSGYSDMALGMGKMMGFNFPENFRYPYQSKSVSEFWRRWHITLGNWFKSYVYFPLGGSRKGWKMTLRNLLIVWFLTGLWHGASWNFVIWGLYFGIFIIAEKFFLGKFLEKLPGTVRILYTFLIAVFGWVFFDTANLTAAFEFFGAMFGAKGVFVDDTTLYLIKNYGLVLCVSIFASTDLFNRIWNSIREKLPVLANWSTPFAKTIIMITSIAYLVNATYNPFLYFNF